MNSASPSCSPSSGRMPMMRPEVEKTLLSKEATSMTSGGSSTSKPTEKAERAPLSVATPSNGLTAGGALQEENLDVHDNNASWPMAATWKACGGAEQHE